MSFGGNPLVDGSAAFEGGRYPTLPSNATGAVRTNTEVESGNWLADVNVPSRGEGDAALDRIAPKVYGGDKRVLLPTLPGQSEVLSPLLSWWVLLFGLSIFARYHPALWAASLDVQRSKDAVPLEAVLEQGSELLPALIYEAIFMN